MMPDRAGSYRSEVKKKALNPFMVRGHGTHLELTAITVPAIRSGSLDCNGERLLSCKSAASYIMQLNYLTCTRLFDF